MHLSGAMNILPDHELKKRQDEYLKILAAAGSALDTGKSMIPPQGLHQHTTNNEGDHTHGQMIGRGSKFINDLDLLMGRLKIAPSDRSPFEHIHTHASSEVIFVFIVVNGQAVTLEDELNMYPSDKMVTAIRLLIG